MANEGSTKATYEELESDVRRWKDASDANRDEAMRQQDGKLLWKQRHERLLADYKTSETSLARVRGLLQHVSDIACGLSCGGDSDDALAEIKRLTQGTESADIGKLDTADKSVGAMASPTCEDCGHSENCMCYSMKICMCKSGGSMESIATKQERCCNCGSEVIRLTPDGKYAHRSTINEQSCSRAVPCRRDTCDRGCKAHGTAHPTWMQFVQGKTVESSIEQGDWHIIQFSDGTTFQFTSNDKFVMVEASPQ